MELIKLVIVASSLAVLEPSSLAELEPSLVMLEPFVMVELLMRLHPYCSMHFMRQLTFSIYFLRIFIKLVLIIF